MSRSMIAKLSLYTLALATAGLVSACSGVDIGSNPRFAAPAQGATKVHLVKEQIGGKTVSVTDEGGVTTFKFTKDGKFSAANNAGKTYATGVWVISSNDTLCLDGGSYNHDCYEFYGGADFASVKTFHPVSYGSGSTFYPASIVQ
jgi:hypothetical protein